MHARAISSVIANSIQNALHCVRSFVCPVGYVRQNTEANAAQCWRNGVECPEGLFCFCHPCVPDLQVVTPLVTLLLQLCAPGPH